MCIFNWSYLMSDLFETNYEDGEEYEGDDVPYFDDDYNDGDADIEFDEDEE